MKFSLYEDTSKVKDSLQFDSNTPIASLSLDNGKLAEILVRGEVRITFEGEVYRQPSTFPAPLKELIASGTLWLDNDPRVYVSENNWFELFYDANAPFVDNCECVDIEGLSKGEVYELIADMVNQTEGKEIVPNTYDEFIKKQKQSSNLER